MRPHTSNKCVIYNISLYELLQPLDMGPSSMTHACGARTFTIISAILIEPLNEVNDPRMHFNETTIVDWGTGIMDICRIFVPCYI